jgi:hypothetical protein
MINQIPVQFKSIIKIPTPGEITIKAENAGYTLWEEDIIIEDEENVTMLVEMEKEG